MEDSEREVESVQNSVIDSPPEDEVSNSIVSSENEIVLPALQILPLFIEPKNKIAKKYYHGPNQNNPFPLESSNNSSRGMIIRSRISVPSTNNSSRGMIIQSRISVPRSVREEEEEVNRQNNYKKVFNKKAFPCLVFN